MNKNFYLQPTITPCFVKIEVGFANSWGAGTPGGDIDYDDYGDEL